MNRRGVTLLELIIVMVIIGIGATLLAPGIGTWIPIYRLKGATRDVVSTLRTAQMKAISINTDYQVNFSNATTYVLEYRNTLGVFVTEGSPQTLPSGIQFTTFPRIFQFNPNSTASLTGALTLTNTKGSTRTITLTTATGRIRVDPPL
ncbi:MAG: prepilin-type N-terminal cleavage/methylation domain-containing protein [Deltaproteobacteria bacterium]|nr:prepilin-type N-terminal cleavage/methylation domain-containing protein [Deltaproteobacteria bacterium]